MILKSKTKFFVVRQRKCIKVFVLKIPGGLNITLFLKNRREASFYKKEQRPKFFGKLEFYKLFILTPKKARFWFLKKKSPQKCFPSWRDFDSTLKTIVTQMSFWLVFLKMHQKQLVAVKTPFWPFLVVINFFLYISTILTKTTFVRPLFLKLKQNFFFFY